MDLSVSVFLFLLGFIFFFIALFEERSIPRSEEEEEKSDFTVMTLLVITTILMFCAGVAMMSVTEVYVSGVTGERVETMPLSQYMPFGWIGIGLGVFCAYLTANKILIIFDHQVLE